MVWPGLIEGFCTVCDQPRVDLNPRPFAQKATTLTTAPGRPHTKKVKHRYKLRQPPVLELTDSSDNALFESPNYASVKISNTLPQHVRQILQIIHPFLGCLEGSHHETNMYSQQLPPSLINVVNMTIMWPPGL